MTFEELLALTKNKRAMAALTDETASEYQQAANALAALAGGQNISSGRGRKKSQTGASDAENGNTDELTGTSPETEHLNAAAS